MNKKKTCKDCKDRFVGCHGTCTYYIERSKFELTYEHAEEKMDVYTRMLDYLPEIKSIEDDAYITLDECANLCYPKKQNGI